MTLTGTKLMGQEIVVQASQAEKNRAAQAAKFKKEIQDKTSPSVPSEGPMRISIEGFDELLEGLTENDLYKVLVLLFSYSHHLDQSNILTFQKQTKNLLLMFNSRKLKMPEKLYEK